MAKWKDFMPELKIVATIANPLYGVGLSLIEKLFIKPKKKAEVMLEGNKTYIGIAVVIIPMIAKMFGYEVSAGFSADATILLNDVVSLVGAVIATYGRAKAKTDGLFVK